MSVQATRLQAQTRPIPQSKGKPRQYCDASAAFSTETRRHSFRRRRKTRSRADYVNLELLYGLYRSVPRNPEWHMDVPKGAGRQLIAMGAQPEIASIEWEPCGRKTANRPATSNTSRRRLVAPRSMMALPELRDFRHANQAERRSTPLSASDDKQPMINKPLPVRSRQRMSSAGS